MFDVNLFEIFRIVEAHTCLLATAPLAGRLAFAGLFAGLIAWLLWLPIERLSDKAVSVDQPEAIRSSAPSANIVRYTAVVIAALQMLLYLFWQ